MQASGGEPRPFADTFFQRQDLTARSKIDVSKARLETRGCKWPGAGDVPIHFNNAGAALMPSAVVDAYVGYIKQEEEMGGYEVAAQRFEDTERFYSAAAKLLNCNSDEIAFVESATRGWHLAFYSLPLKAGDRVITSAMDYGSNFVAYLQAKQRFDIEIVIVPDDEEGQLDLAVLKKELAHSRARVLSISHIPTGGGVVNPAEEIGRLAKAANVPYFLDAVQSVGQLPVDVQALQCDVLTVTGRKFLRGPRATGLLFVRRGFLSELDPCMLDQYGAQLLSETSFRARTDARRFEMWEQNMAGKVGLCVAMEYCVAIGLEAIATRVHLLASTLRQGLGEMEGVTVTDRGRHLSGIVTFVVDNVDAAQVKSYLAKRKISISISAASSGGSRVWYDRRGLTEVLRASPHYYNTEEEVERFLKAVAAAVTALKDSPPPRSRL